MTTSKNITLITNINNAVISYSNTGNGKQYCYDCGAEFLLDSAYVEVGKSASATCSECGGRCANPNIVGIKTMITGTWKHEVGTGDLFVSDSGEEFYFSGADEEGENFFRGNKDRAYLVHKGELLNWDRAVVLNSIVGTCEEGEFVYCDRGFIYREPHQFKYRRPAIVIKEEVGNDVYKRYTVIPIG